MRGCAVQDARLRCPCGAIAQHDGRISRVDDGRPQIDQRLARATEALLQRRDRLPPGSVFGSGSQMVDL